MQFTCCQEAEITLGELVSFILGGGSCTLVFAVGLLGKEVPEAAKQCNTQSERQAVVKAFLTFV